MTASNSMHYLICDVNIKEQGHYIGYNQYIVDNIEKLENKNPRIQYSFLYNKEADQLLDFPAHVKERVYFLNENGWTSPSTANRIKLFKKITSFASEHNIDHVILMDLDQYQLPIFLTPGRFKISGVLFRPHHRIKPSNSSFTASLKSKLQRFKKIIAEKLLINTKSMDTIFILNDEEGVKLLNQTHNCIKFKYLADPVFSYPSTISNNSNPTYKFLIFGAINERKNITAILKAYDLANFNRETELLIVGSAEEIYIQNIREIISSLTTVGPKKSISVKAGFVSNNEMDYYFSSCNVCLLIYKDFYGSSGLLGRASLHKKKVIGANVGLLNELISKNNLGITCDPNNIHDIAKALEEIIEVNIDAACFENFYLSYSPETFINTLLTPKL